MAVLSGLAGDRVSRIADEDGWLSVRIEPDRAADVNRALATAGIFASGLETGSDLEELFLELTPASSRRPAARALPGSPERPDPTRLGKPGGRAGVARYGSGAA